MEQLEKMTIERCYASWIYLGTWTIMHTYTPRNLRDWSGVHDRTHTASTHGYGALRALPALSVHVCATQRPHGTLWRSQ